MIQQKQNLHFIMDSSHLGGGGRGLNIYLLVRMFTLDSVVKPINEEFYDDMAHTSVSFVSAVLLMQLIQPISL